jgi:ATP-dependent helicase/DNAse subunit B
MIVSAHLLGPDVKSRLQDAWQGEVFGMAMYRSIAEQQKDSFRQWQWTALHQLEIETGAEMRQLLLRHGLSVTELEESRRAGLAEAARIVVLPWLEMMKEFADDLPATIDDYRTLERACALEGRDAETMRLLVDHEVASLDFAQVEMRGDSQNSINPVLALLKEPPRFPG